MCFACGHVLAPLLVTFELTVVPGNTQPIFHPHPLRNGPAGGDCCPLFWVSAASSQPASSCATTLSTTSPWFDMFTRLFGSCVLFWAAKEQAEKKTGPPERRVDMSNQGEVVESVVAQEGAGSEGAVEPQQSGQQSPPAGPFRRGWGWKIGRGLPGTSVSSKVTSSCSLTSLS
ncbi:hypothetical protein LSTR_LSTR009721 [Laodelphax striatellus]|uniref:Uncharacterized protein n=1 Tax=Laodelphax striatellus TaxID=195883 RepID=A0A482WWD1_LAOST|nr:hypothetical protein LSTR_LSTR009721 [Laodelphax striatellus]